MPIYEYRCLSCRKRSSILLRSFSSAATPACQHCGGGNLVKLMSRFAVLRGEDAAVESDLSGIDESDPRSVARMVRRMAAEEDEPIDAEMEQALDQMESGRIPEGLDNDLGGDGNGEDITEDSKALGEN